GFHCPTSRSARPSLCRRVLISLLERHAAQHLAELLVETERAGLRPLRAAMPPPPEGDVAELRQRPYRPTVGLSPCSSRHRTPRSTWSSGFPPRTSGMESLRQSVMGAGLDRSRA